MSRVRFRRSAGRAFLDVPYISGDSVDQVIHSLHCVIGSRSLLSTWNTFFSKDPLESVVEVGEPSFEPAAVTLTVSLFHFFSVRPTVDCG